MSGEETQKQASGISEAGLHLLMDDINTNTTKSAIEWILEANFANTEKKHKELNLVIC